MQRWLRQYTVANAMASTVRPEDNPLYAAVRPVRGFKVLLLPACFDRQEWRLLVNVNGEERQRLDVHGHLHARELARAYWSLLVRLYKADHPGQRQPRFPCPF